MYTLGSNIIGLSWQVKNGSLARSGMMNNGLGTSVAPVIELFRLNTAPVATTAANDGISLGFSWDKKGLSAFWRNDPRDSCFARLVWKRLPLGGGKAGMWVRTWGERTWDLTSSVPKAGTYDITFQYTEGEHRLDIAWAQLEQNGAFSPAMNTPG